MELMKSGLSKPAIKRIALALSRVNPKFNQTAFENDCLNSLDSLELKERVNHIIDVLNQYLPNDFEQACDILCSTKRHWDYGNPDDSLRSFAAWPIIDYIAKFGLTHPDYSLKSIKHLTSMFSAEFAIRPFIIEYPDLCLRYFNQWITDESEDVRRLVSEGTRPKLPWGIQLKPFIADPSPNLPLLTQLKNDKSLYVRRSVANHLNDISKDHPQLVIDTCKEWLKVPSKEISWIITHATRTLVKSGNLGVFPLLGYTENPRVLIKSFQLANEKVFDGESIYFNLTLEADSSVKQSFVVDYAIHFNKANGKSQPKVFKLKNIVLSANESIEINKSFSFKPITTRKYYSGIHAIEILVNGVSASIKEFDYYLEER